MKFIIDWVKRILGLFSSSEPGEVVSVQPEPVKEEPKEEAPAPKKVTKASLNKLTKAKLVEHAEKHGMKVDSKLKKADLVDSIFKQQK